ncbi:hypothetical protein HOY34_07625 [Xinfangfangia sp. D13-10-4-6]|uniref:hypothetical protein n=1 Tax=Pseudogemmobacter hezensis TaxID=2737662 RepID=UPI0015574627|nr:hypothetical protein [Pseudogemmobacter hezensis]NPD15072.1 hypothetical protein [Pseudogemmobacter hezensis]
MANYYTHFSCLLDVGSSEKAQQAFAIYTRMAAECEESNDPNDLWGGSLAFEIQIQDGPDSTVLWISDEDGGDVDSVITFVLRCAEELDLSGLWGFTYADTCSSPRVDAFGGGAHVVDLSRRKSIGWVATREWLAAVLNGEDIDAVEALAQ